MLNADSVSLSEPEVRILIFTRALNYVHESTLAATSYLTRQFKLRGCEVVVSGDAQHVETERLLFFDILVLLNNSGDCFEIRNEKITEFLAMGKSVLGVHACIAAFLDGQDPTGARSLKAKNAFMQSLFGAHFLNHPPPQSAKLKINYAQREKLGIWLRKSLPPEINHLDEYFNYNQQPTLLEDVQALAHVDSASFEGSLMGEHHPIAWCREASAGRGRIYYYALGHFAEMFERPDEYPAMLLLEAGIYFVLDKHIR